ATTSASEIGSLPDRLVPPKCMRSKRRPSISSPPSCMWSFISPAAGCMSGLSTTIASSCAAAGAASSAPSASMPLEIECLMNSLSVWIRTMPASAGGGSGSERGAPDWRAVRRRNGVREDSRRRPVGDGHDPRNGKFARRRWRKRWRAEPGEGTRLLRAWAPSRTLVLSHRYLDEVAGTADLDRHRPGRIGLGHEPLRHDGAHEQRGGEKQPEQSG